MNPYSLEYLKHKFTEHSIKYEHESKEQIKSFRKNYPNEKLPDHFKEHFNLPEALSCICDEILKLKNPMSGSCCKRQEPGVLDSETKEPEPRC